MIGVYHPNSGIMILMSRMTIEKYSEIQVKDPVFFYVFGLFKISVIVQQIYFRYKSGYSKDKRFSKLIDVVKVCSLVAYQAIKKNKIDDLF